MLISEEKRQFLESNMTNVFENKKTALQRQNEMDAMRRKGSRPERVRLIICNHNNPEKTQKRALVTRAPNLSTLFSAARETLFMKRPKAAFLLNSGLYLADTMTLEEDTVVVISSKLPEGVGGEGGGGGGKKAPPTEEELAAKAAARAAEIQHLTEVKQLFKQQREKQRGGLGKGRMGWAPAQAQVFSRMLQEKMRALQNQNQGPYQSMLRQRRGLPIWSKREEILAMVETNQVLVLSGATGSGKSTQVPQFLLDSWIEAGRASECNIICTQPRRISATGLAERVAAERCERGVGETVGYSIRLESKMSDRTCLTFVTTGVLLRRLQDDALLEGVSHVIVDEVHERDINSDFLLILLRELCARRPTLKVVLMSATLQEDLFRDYFRCPGIAFPGRTFPVTHHYLDEIKTMVAASKPPPGLGGGGGFGQGGRGRGGGGGGRGGGGRGKGGGGRGDRKDGPGRGGKESSGPPLVSPKAEEDIDYFLLLDLLTHLVLKKTMSQAPMPQISDDENVGGGILVFCSGFNEIDTIIKRMSEHRVLGDKRLVQAFPLHSSLTSDQQSSVFRRMPRGVTKIVVSTNIAETSITIDDISFVVDTGRVKETRYDPETHMSSLVAVWTSKAAAAQRAGRAGRVRAGDCFRLYTQEFFETQMPEFTLPEMLRTPLEELCLTIVSLELGAPADFLVKAIQPPPPEAIATATKCLREIEAIKRIRRDEGKAGEYDFLLTPLGIHLSNLPVDARIGKMLIMASIFGCLDPILTVAACLSYRSPFTSPFGMQDEADRAHEKFASSMSDHLAALEAYEGWAALRHAPYRERKAYCQENFLSIATLEMIWDLRRELRRQLEEIGFVERGRRRQPRGPSPRNGQGQGQGQRQWQGQGGGDEDEEDEMETQEHADPNLLKCILCSALYPQVGKLIRPSKPGEPSVFELKDKTRVAVHPSSINFKRLQTSVRPSGKDVFLLYHKKVMSTKVYVYDSTFVSPLALALFGGSFKLEWETDLEKTVVATIDKWITLRMTEANAVLIKYLRKELEDVLTDRFVDPKGREAKDRIIIDTVRRLLVTDKNVTMAL